MVYFVEFNNQTFEVNKKDTLEIKRGDKVYVADKQTNQTFKAVLLSMGEYCEVECLEEHPFDSNTFTLDEIQPSKEDAEKFLKRLIEDKKEVFSKEDPLKRLFKAWANQYPDGHPQFLVEAMRQVLKEKYNTEV